MKEISLIDFYEPAYKLVPEIKPPKYQFKVGDRCTWDNAPGWWNPTGEKIRQLEGDRAWLDYWASSIAIEKLILVEEGEGVENA